MFPTTTSTIAGYSNKVFFANDGVNVAFDAFPIERELVSVFNPSEHTIYLGKEDVSTSNYLYEAKPGKLSVFEINNSDAIYAVSDSSEITVLYGSEYY